MRKGKQMAIFHVIYPSALASREALFIFFVTSRMSNSVT